MAASSSSFILTPLAQADNQGTEPPRGAPLQWYRTKFNLYNPEARGMNGFSVLPEVCFSGADNVNKFWKRRQQEPTDFIYDLLKLHKQLELRMSEEALVDHIFGGKIHSRL
ncbi:uncharacterized protein TNCV_4244431 [Trichonephila clavipes]|nr:uncharacterized protein TNCV_4244431 [Trichonephila clavipes]